MTRRIWVYCFAALLGLATVALLISSVNAALPASTASPTQPGTGLSKPETPFDCGRIKELGIDMQTNMHAAQILAARGQDLGTLPGAKIPSGGAVGGRPLNLASFGGNDANVSSDKVPPLQGTATPTVTATPTCGAPGGIRVLIAYAYTSGPPSLLQSLIQAEPGVTAVDLFNAYTSTPNLGQIQQYTEVVAFSNSPWNNATAMGDVLADYEDGGGVVVVATFAWDNRGGWLLGGRWMTGGYTPFDSTSATNFSNAGLGTYLAGHPLMQGVSTLTAYFRNGVTLAAGATQVATYTDSIPIVASKLQAGHTGVGINAYLGNSNQFSGDWGKLIVNAARWLAPRPLCVTASPTLTGTPPTNTRTATPSTPSATPTCSGPGTPGPWVIASPFPFSARGPALASDGTYVYASGGYDGINAHLDNYRYDPVADTWTALAPSTVAHFLGPAVYYNGNVYVLGGFGASNPINAVQIYNVSANAWTAGAPMPDTLSDTAAAYWNGKIYVAGGYNGAVVVNTLYIYDIAGNSWTTGAPLPSTRLLAGFGIINGKFYVAGGQDFGGLHPELYIYDIAAGTWSTGTPLPSLTNGPGSAVVNGQLWVIGGGNPPMAITQIYDPATSNWTSGPPMNVSRLWFYAAVAGRAVVATGGDHTPGTPITDNEVSLIPSVPCASATSTVAPPTATLTRTVVPPSSTTTPAPPATATPPPVPSDTPTSSPVPTQISTQTPVVPPTNTVPAPTNTPGGPTDTPGPPTATATACSINFSDVHPSDYFYEPVRYLFCHRVISGYSDGTFRPYSNTTRSQMVKIVVFGFNRAIVTPAGTNYSFTDVTRANPFFSVVETAYADGIVSGYTCGSAPAGPCDAQHRPWFLPYAYVTRGQLSKIDVIAAGWTLFNPPSPTFTDVAHGSTFYTVIETAYCHGVISGYNDHTFRPFSNATRGQISKIVYLSIVNPPVSCGP